MLAIARALVQSPKLLLIDEMSMGLAPVAVESLMPVIRRVADEHDASVIMVEQHVQLALEVADEAIVDGAWRRRIIRVRGGVPQRQHGSRGGLHERSRHLGLYRVDLGPDLERPTYRSGAHRRRRRPRALPSSSRTATMSVHRVGADGCIAARSAHAKLSSLRAAPRRRSERKPDENTSGRSAQGPAGSRTFSG